MKKKCFDHADRDPLSEPDDLQEGSEEDGGQGEGCKGEGKGESPGREGEGKVGQELVQLPAYACLRMDYHFKMGKDSFCRCYEMLTVSAIGRIV